MIILFLVVAGVGLWEHNPGLTICSFLALLTFDKIR